MVQLSERVRFSDGKMPEMTGVVRLPCWAAVTFSTTSFSPFTRMISCWWRMGCQAPAGVSYSAVAPVPRVCSIAMSWTVAPRLVKPQAMWALWPTMMKGEPGRETPETWNSPVGVGASRSASYQVPGTPRLRCMSFERSGLPEAVWVPETAQLPEPALQPSQRGFLRVCWRVRRSSMEAVLVWRWAGAVAPSRDAHLRRIVRAEDGAPGLIADGISRLVADGASRLLWDSSRGTSGMSFWGAVRSMM